MVSVLFVCKGNICRSPMAEAILKSMLLKENMIDQIHVESRGTENWHEGKLPHTKTMSLLEKNLIDYTGSRAKQIKDIDIKEYEIIVLMDTENLKKIDKLLKKFNKKPYFLLDFLSDVESKRDLPDPYFTQDFEGCYTLVSKACEGLINHLKLLNNSTFQTEKVR